MLTTQELWCNLVKITDDYPWLRGDPLLLIAADGKVRWIPSTCRIAGDAILLSISHLTWEEMTPETLRDVITLALRDGRDKGLVP